MSVFKIVGHHLFVLNILAIMGISIFLLHSDNLKSSMDTICKKHS